MEQATDRVSDDRVALRGEVERIGHILSPQGPIETFVHHNTLHGFQHLSFEEAAFEAEGIFEGRCFLPNEENRAHYTSGRITDDDLDAVTTDREELFSDEVLASADGQNVTVSEVRRLHLVYGIEEIEAGKLPFEVREMNATRSFRDDVPETTRERVLADDDGAGFGRVGWEWTLSRWMKNRTGLDVPGYIRRAMERPPSVKVESGERSLDRMRIPAEKREGYLACVEREIGERASGEFRERWLSEEAEVVRAIARRLFDVRGTYEDIETHIRRNPEAHAVGSLWSASFGAFGLDDPMSGLDPRHFRERDQEGGAAESTRRRFEGMEFRGGTSMPLDEGLQEKLVAAVQYAPEAPAGMTAALSKPYLHRDEFEALEEALEKMAGRNESLGYLVSEVKEQDPRRQMLASVKGRMTDELGRIGRDRTHSDALLKLTGEDVTARVNEVMIRLCAAFLDEGQSAWRMPERNRGFYDAWREVAVSDSAMGVEGVEGWKEAVERLPEGPEDAVIEALQELGVEDRESYLRRIMVALPGWASMINWRMENPHYPRQQAQPIDLVHYVAVRLCHERLLVEKLCAETWGIVPADLRDHLVDRPGEFFVRRELFDGNLPESLADSARFLVEKGASEGDFLALADRIWHEIYSPGHTAHGSAWRMFHLAQFLGFSAEEVSSLSEGERDALISALDGFPASAHGPVWLDAFERHYRDEVLGAVAANIGEGRWRTRESRPKAQITFCIDEREEAIRRHLEEIEGKYETFGTGGFFGVAMKYRNLGAHDSKPLSPQPEMSTTTVAEVPRPESVEARKKQKALGGWEEVFHNSYWEAKRNAISAYFTYDFAASFVTIPLFGRILAPRRYAKAAERAHHRVFPQVRTRLTLNMEEGDGLGYSLEERASRVEATLQNIGLVSGFARLVVFLGHGSMSQNNPHESAHDCGACGGGHGGPNGRAFAAMANQPEVREILRERGIHIPDDTWFVGGQHNTCSELITYSDVEDIPESHKEEFRSLVADLDEARARSAQERCRRFGSAPKDKDPKTSLAHIEGRAHDLSQVRPEWGHATNACAFFGRRSLTQGLFLDRRAFLISYDPTIDPTGEIIERILLAIGPVGAGISLEYYFSTVDNETFGCDTKLPHNVSGLIGVMEGTFSDLRTGLPWQMVEVHEPMRLQCIVEATPETLGEIYGRQPAIQTLVGNAWLHLVSMHPETGEFNVFVPDKGFVPWDKEPSDLPEVGESFEWYRGKTEFLPPARISGNGGSPRV